MIRPLVPGIHTRPNVTTYHNMLIWSKKGVWAVQVWSGQVKARRPKTLKLVSDPLKEMQVSMSVRFRFSGLGSRA